MICKERVLICGDRNWRSLDTILITLRILLELCEIECVIEGEARGADKMGAEAAEILGIPVLRFPADWDKHGKAAGPIRNRQMLTEGKPTLVVAFHQNIHNSKGTADMLRAAEKAGVPTVLITGYYAA